ncbi:hypothetical protein HPHPA5_0062 [Helicobacter pylori Hp A-5]|nr:hypothetical protein HPHPA5_0062 [Helicobacter pylori Hp A-5]
MLYFWLYSNQMLITKAYLMFFKKWVLVNRFIVLDLIIIFLKG